jgi:FeS assembly SUF system regulator
MLRMSKLTDYGTMVLAQLAASDPGWTTAGTVADATHLGQPTVSKLLKSLVHAGLVVSSRGVQGGYALARPAASISAAEILDALDGPVAITECSSSTGGCDLES